MEGTDINHVQYQSSTNNKNGSVSTDLNNIPQDSSNIENKNTDLTNIEHTESDNGDHFATEFEDNDDNLLDSDPYPDLDDELSGIIYISRIPPFMGVGKLRSYFSNFGKVGKIYAHPEPIGQYNKRVKLGGNKRLKFTHGWIQFYDKKVAKNVAKLLNNQPFSDSKTSSFWKYDIWNIKYLPKFKWHHLVEYWSEHKRESKEQLNLLLQRERKRNLRYLEQLEIEKREHQIELKKANNSKFTNESNHSDKEPLDNDVAVNIKNKSADKLSKKSTHNKKRKKIKARPIINKEIPVNLLNTIAL